MAGPSAIRAGRAFVELFADDSMLVRGLRRAEARIRKFGTNLHNIGQKLGTLGLGLGVPFAASVKVFAEFDDTMRAVKAVTSATADEFDMLTGKAKLLGRTTSFTTHQVAEAMLQLGRAGFAPREIDRAIASILNLSRATRTDLAESARIASAALRAFDLPASQMTRVCDVMVAAANNSAQTLEDLGFSMSYCAPIAQQYGMTVEETCKAIGALSNYGIKASQAGTTFRRILVNLADKRVQRRLKGLGVVITDKETGKMRNASAILKDLGKAMQSMSESQQISLTKDLFGVWAMAGSAKLTIAQFDRLYDSIDNAAGIADRVAREMDSGIAGSFRMLYSAVETVAITVGETLAPALKRIADFWTQAASGLVVYLTTNRKLIVQCVKVVLGLLAVGAALIGLGVGMLAASKILAIVASTLSTVLYLLVLPVNLLGKLLNLILFAAAALVSVFSAVAGALGSVVAVVAVVGRTILAVLSGLGSVMLSVMLGLGRVFVTLAFGIVGAIGIVLRGVVTVVAALAPVIGTVVALLGTVLIGLTRGLIIGIGMIGSLIASLFPIVVSGLSAMLTVLSFAYTMIAGGLSAAFAAISLVVRAAFLRVGAMILSGLSIVFSAVGSILTSVFVPILSAVGGFLGTLIGMIASAVAATGAVVGSILAAVGAWIGAAVATAVTWFVVQFATVVGMTAAFIGHFIAALGTAIASVLAAMSPMIVVLLTIAAAAGAVYLFMASLGGVGNRIAAIFMQAVQVVGNCLAWIFNAVVALAGRVILALIDCLGTVATAAWNMARRVGGIVAGVMGGAVAGIRSAFASAWNGLAATFSALFGALGDIVTSFGDFFLNVFGQIGTAVDWAKEKFGQLCSFAQETYGAIAAALGRGDIEAAIGVVWATIKLIWTQGTTSLVSTWHWLTETLQTTWATCVFKISELLTQAWYGVQEFWTETVYTMQTLWTEFSSGVVSAWKTAEKAIAHGLGWIIAKMEGLDPDQMAATIEEDYKRQTQQREAQKSQALTDIRKKRDDKMASLKSEKDGTLDILRSDFEKRAGERTGLYAGKIAEQQKELDAARAAYDEAINRARNPQPVPLPEGGETLEEKLRRKVAAWTKGLQAGFGDKVSVTGSFSAAAIAGMGASSVMDRVAVATEKSEKHLGKIAEREEKKNDDKKDEKKPEEKRPVFEGGDPTMNEMKIQTRLLRDIAQGGRAFA